VHLISSNRLTDLVGDAGKRCTPPARATTRSRPTCASTCAPIDHIVASSRYLQRTLLDIAEKNRDGDAGFTHLQVAQPISFGHHVLAYFEMFHA